MTPSKMQVKAYFNAVYVMVKTGEGNLLDFILKRYRVSRLACFI